MPSKLKLTHAHHLDQNKNLHALKVGNDFLQFYLLTLLIISLFVRLLIVMLLYDFPWSLMH